MFKYALVIALFAVAGVFCEDEATPFVSGGLQAVVGQYPSDCSIDSPFQIHCGCVLVNDRHVLTAANCVTNGTILAHPAWFRIILGDNNIFVPTSGRVFAQVSHIYPHDGYVPATNLNDLAIMRLSQPLTLPSNTLEPVIFNPRPIADNHPCQYSGWGRVALQTTVVQPLKMVINTPIVNRNTCNGPTMANPNRALESMICAGMTAATGTVPQATCTGNLGGGLYCDNELSGILVLGMGCGAPNHPGIYIQTRLYQAWINSQLTRTDTIAAGTVYPRP